MRSPRRRVYLHVGLPKAASSSLQRWCADHRDFLEGKGVFYPETNRGLLAPKHEFVVSELLAGHCRSLARLLEVHPQQDLFLSSEGLVYRFHEFSSEALACLRQAMRPREVELVVIKRDFESWSRSLYAQSILNRPGPTRSYGGSMTLREFRSSEHFLRVADCASRLAEYQAAFGADHCSVFEVHEDWFGGLACLMGFADGDAKVARPARENQSVSPELVEIVRQVNAMGLADELRSNFLAFIAAYSGATHNVLKTYRRITEGGRARTSAVEVWSRLSPGCAAVQAEAHALLAFLFSGPARGA
jgi:hypothetical protein